MSPRTSKQYKEIREQSREKIMMAALELFAGRGFHNTSISQIAKQAGVAKGLIYNYFSSKEDLLHAIIDRALAEGDEFFAKMAGLSDARQQLRYLIGQSFELMETQFDYTKLLTSLSLQLDQFPGIMETVREKYSSTLPLLEQLLDRIGVEDAAGEAKLLAALLDGIGVQYIVLHHDYPLEEMKQLLYKRYNLNERS